MIFENRIYFKVAAFFILVLFVMSFSNCGIFSELRTIFSSPKNISENISVNEKWTVITPPKPLTASAKHHQILIKTDDVKTFDKSDNTGQTLEYRNGKSGKVEAVLFDETGNEYILGIVAVGGKGTGFFMGKIHNANDKDSNEPDFPYERKYTKLKIRSDVEFQVKKIEWVGEIQK